MGGEGGMEGGANPKMNQDDTSRPWVSKSIYLFFI